MAIVNVRKAIVAAGMTIVSTRKPIVTFGTAAVTSRNGFVAAGLTKERAGMSIVSVRNDAVGRRKHKNHRREERSWFIHHARHSPRYFYIGVLFLPVLVAQSRLIKPVAIFPLLPYFSKLPEGHFY